MTTLLASAPLDVPEELLWCDHCPDDSDTWPVSRLIVIGDPDNTHDLLVLCVNHHDAHVRMRTSLAVLDDPGFHFLTSPDHEALTA